MLGASWALGRIIMTPNKILIAEDDPIVSKMLWHCVSKMGFAPVVSSNGKRAWDVLCDNVDIALLITDMSMPEMSGKELIQAVRESDLLSNIPIIIVSGVVGPNEIADTLKLGASRFLPKPVDTKMLQNYISLLLEK